MELYKLMMDVMLTGGNEMTTIVIHKLPRSIKHDQTRQQNINKNDTVIYNLHKIITKNTTV
jgi:hypothetical protein